MAIGKPIQGEFLWKELQSATGCHAQYNAADEIGIAEATLSKILQCKDDFEYEKYEQELWKNKEGKPLLGSDTSVHRELVFESFIFLKGIESLPKEQILEKAPELARDFLIASEYFNEDGSASNLFLRKTSTALKKYSETNQFQPIGDKKPNLSKALSAPKKRQGFLVERLIESSQVGYVSSPIETLIQGKIRSNVSSRILITGLAGCGKTALMTKLSKLSTNGLNATFFFVDDPNVTDRNSALDFYKSFFAQVSAHYGIEIDRGHCNTLEDAGDFLEHCLLELAGQGRISIEKPLVVFIDALDEMEKPGSLATIKGDPLRLPEVEISGVHFVISERMSSSGDLQGGTVITRHSHHINLDSGEYGELHKNTVECYVEQTCSSDPRVTCYHQLGTLDEKISFVKELCLDAKHNFMLLRCALNESEILDQLGGEIKLSGTLEEYYEDHLSRMTKRKSSHDLETAVFCLTFEPNILLDTYLFLLDPVQSVKKDENSVFVALNEWVRQGLVSVNRSDGLIFLSMYHRTYREFLAVQRDETYTPGEFERLMLTSIQKHVPGALDGLVGTKAAKTKFISLLDLSLRLAATARNYSFCQLVVCSDSFWTRMAQLGVPFDFALRNISSAKKENADWINLKQCFSQIASYLLALADKGSLIDSNGASVDRTRLFYIVYQTRATSEPGQPHLVDFLREAILSGSKND